MRARGFEPYLSAKLTETQAAARSALAVLQKHQWAATGWDTSFLFCPECMAPEDADKHTEDCALAAAIRDLEAVL